MERSEFNHLRDLQGKVIEDDIILERSKENSPLLTTTVSIKNTGNTDVKIRIEWNEKTDSKTVNVMVAGTGPICRLDIDTKAHKPYGTSHKHSLSTPDCPHPSINLGNKIEDRSDLSGKSIEEIFKDFCQRSNITHHGVFRIVD